MLRSRSLVRHATALEATARCAATRVPRTKIAIADTDNIGSTRDAGEYNLRLGVIKELRPELVATHQGDVRVFEGHAFIVEAAVSLGGQGVRPGVNVHRFANRIPLLFEGGSDVVTRTAMKRINWQSYKINHSVDRVGVFVSIVSTKIPFKGAGKEYIGARGWRTALCSGQGC